MLIKDLRADDTLAPFIKPTCCENEVCVDVDSAISVEDSLIIKVDDFYNVTVPNPDTPKSPDCLIVQKCEKGYFHVYVVELKNVKHLGDLDKDDIREKFQTCLNDFMSNRFRSHFYDLRHQFDLKLYLVAGRVRESYTLNFTLDFLLTMRPLLFANRFYAIQGENPNPLVRPC